MSEKRFIVKSEKIGRFHNIFVQTDKIEYLLTGDFDNDSEMIKEIVDLLNEQQATISKQLDQIIELQDKYRILEFNHKRLKERNKKQYGKIGEQQATIDKLKEELELTANTKLFSRRKLEEENEQLRQELNDCEKIRYSIFEKMNEFNYIQSNAITLKEAEDGIRVTKYEELFDDE